MTDCRSPLYQGELPWRTDFGAKLKLLMHQKNSAVQEELARVYVKEALARWLEEADPEEVSAELWSDF